MFLRPVLTRVHGQFEPQEKVPADWFTQTTRRPAGARVAAVSRTADQVAESVRMIREAGAIGMAITADVSAPSARGPMPQAVERTLGPVDVLVKNAGLGRPFGPTLEGSAEDWWRTFEVNVRGPFLT